MHAGVRLDAMHIDAYPDAGMCTCKNLFMHGFARARTYTCKFIAPTCSAPTKASERASPAAGGPPAGKLLLTPRATLQSLA